MAAYRRGASVRVHPKTLKSHRRDAGATRVLGCTLRLAFAATAAALGPLVFAQSVPAPASQPAQPTQPVRAVNPHWSPQGCRYCHQSGVETAKSIPRDQINELCWRCHDGRQAHREVHPVGRLFVPGEVVRPDGWPAPGGRLGCVTCHDIRSACDLSGKRPENNSTFLRTVPRATLGGFCGACHVAAAKARGGRYNPHVMLDKQSKPIRNACLFCHQPLFNLADRVGRTGDAGLRADGVVLCGGCHSRHRDYFEPGHIGMQVPAGIKARLVQAERAKAAGSRSAPQSQPAGPEPTLLPLGKGDRIVCVTCHNPHQEGVFPPGSPLGEGAMTEGPRNRLALRGPGEDVCRVCHNE